MKNSILTPFGARLRRRDKESGVALILVLLILVILSGLVLAFFSSVSSETTASGSESAAVSTKAMAENAINIVSSQIVEASRSGDKTNVQSWVSQPGMIRTYDQTGAPARLYKLYSTDKLVEDATGNFKSETIDSDWSTNTALYTDLNEPVRDADGVLNYPIVDPSAVGIVDGFSIDQGKLPSSTGGNANALPMPVKWMYLMRDGSMRAGVKVDANTVTVEKASDINPIVGRIAFWTDDESTKVNINTASEGIYWDMPHVVTTTDIGVMAGSVASKPGLAICQPATGEYQRYPGHPATTSLSPILKKWLPDPQEDGVTLPANTIASRAAAYYNILPRVAQGGSKAGTAIPIVIRSTGSSAAVKPTAKRLYDSVEEMMFSDTGTATERKVTTGGAGALFTKDALEKVKFFLTAHSNAPEVTVFNTPRISMWPESSNSAQRTIFDKTIAFCSSLGFTKTEPLFPYYFQRVTAADPNSGGARSQTMDMDIARNVQLFSYLTSMMREKVPGYGASLSSKFLNDTDQIATYIFDYIRCTNIYDPSAKLQNKYQYTKLSTLASTTPRDPDNPIDYVGVDAGGGEVIPIQINGYQGFGRMMTINKIAFIFYGTNWDRNVDRNPQGQPIVRHYPTREVPATEMACVFTVGLSGVMHGLPAIRPNMFYTVEGLSKFTINGSQPLFPGLVDENGKAGNYIEGAPVRTGEGRGIGGSDDPSFLFTRANEPIFYRLPPPNLAGVRAQAPGDTTSKPFRELTGITRNNYPFFTRMNTLAFTTDENIANPYSPGYVKRFIDIGGGGNTFTFQGGKLTINLYNVDNPNVPLQTFNVIVPDGTFMKPRIEGNNDPAPGQTTNTNNAKPIYIFENAIQPAGVTAQTKAWGILTQKRDPYSVRDVDTAVSLELNGTGGGEDKTAFDYDKTAGDLRMIAGRKDVREQYFHAHQDWSRTQNYRGKAYSFARGTGQDIANTGGSFGVLAPGMKRTNFGIPAYQTRRPDVPTRTMKDTSDSNGVLRKDGGPGDWDTGYGMQKDGPYINMPDIGDVSFIDIDDQNGRPRYPYLQKEDHFLTDQGAGNYYSPNRQIPSSMMLGSIPTGVQRFQPWQTLLFNPKIEDPTHPGQPKNGTVPDHVVADFFWMPVVEPYAISQPFTTAGKINLNYQIQPFTYITRATGIYSLMKSTKFVAMGPDLYKGADPRPNANPTFSLLPDSLVAGRTRFAIEMEPTIKQFEDKFANGGLYKIATEICEIKLYPKAQGITTESGLANFWKTKGSVTGDNLREKPYVDMYPRVTTKSNSYTVHFKVQMLKKSSQTPTGQWVNGRDSVGGEYRGSALIERYIDVNDQAFTNPANDFANKAIGDVNIDNFYKFRTISTKRFAP